MASAKRDENREIALILQNTLGTDIIFPTGVKLTDSTPMHVAVVDGNGDQITSFGGSVSSPLFAPISANSNGDNTIVSATGGKKITAITGALVASGSVNVKFTDGAGGASLTGVMNFVSNSGVQIPYCPVGNFITSVGNALVLNLSSGTLVGGWLVYTLT